MLGYSERPQATSAPVIGGNDCVVGGSERLNCLVSAGQRLADAAQELDSAHRALFNSPTRMSEVRVSHALNDLRRALALWSMSVK